MSDYHVQQLRAVEARMKASRAALAFTVQSVERADDVLGMEKVKPEELRKAAHEVTDVYFVYLFAVFEGILRIHLTQKQPAVRVDRQTKFDQLISLVCKQDKQDTSKSITIDPVLRNRLNVVRDYRNYLAHGKQGIPVPVEFNDALSALNTFVAKLPDPKS